MSAQSHRPTTIRKHVLFLFGLLIFPPHHGVADELSGSAQLEERFRKAAPELLDLAIRERCRTVGVLKFMVKDREKALSPDVGKLNQTLSDRLSMALALATSDRRDVGIIENANAIAEKLNASHMNRSGRGTLLRRPPRHYQLLWESPPVSADAIFTGIAETNADLTKLHVTVQWFRRTDRGDKLQTAFDLTVPMDEQLLLEHSESFDKMGVADEGKTVQSSALENRKEPKLFPFDRDDAPVKFTLKYGGVPQAITFDKSNRAIVVEPKKEQTVSIEVERTEAARGRLGVVVSVNGENTLFRERVKAREGSMWILEPEANQRPSAVKIDGFQMSKKSIIPFRVLSEQRSRQRQSLYGDEAGTISITVFGESDQRAAMDPNAPEESAAIANPIRLPKKPESREAYQETILLQTASFSQRGLIDGVGEDESHVNFVAPIRNPRLLMTATVRYYEPRSVNAE